MSLNKRLALRFSLKSLWIISNLKDDKLGKDLRPIPKYFTSSKVAPNLLYAKFKSKYSNLYKTLKILVTYL